MSEQSEDLLAGRSPAVGEVGGDYRATGFPPRDDSPGDDPHDLLGG